MRREFMVRVTFAFMAALVAATVAWSLATVFRSEPRKVVFYSTQTIERVDPKTGEVSTPVIDGYTGPAVTLGETVPTRGTLRVESSSPVHVTGTVIWEEAPPGKRVVVISGVGGILQPGETQITFDNSIPAEVAAYVTAGGPQRWRITGSVVVNEPDVLGASWNSTAFWLIP